MKTYMRVLLFWIDTECETVQLLEGLITELILITRIKLFACCISSSDNNYDDENHADDNGHYYGLDDDNGDNRNK